MNTNLKPKTSENLTSKATNSAEATANIDLFQIGETEKKNNDLLLNENDDNFGEFGDFVTHRIQSKPIQQSNDLVSFDPFEVNSSTSLASNQQKQNDILFDDLLTPSSNNIIISNQQQQQTLSAQPDLFHIFSTPNINTIPSSFTMPNLQTNQQLRPTINTNKPLMNNANIDNNLWLGAGAQPAAATTTTTAGQVNAQQKPIANSNVSSNSMWDKLGQSVDINLDNLTRYSKGTSSKSNQSNIPMKDLFAMNQNVAASGNFSKVNQFTTPPMSPSSRIITNANATLTNLPSPQTVQMQSKPQQPKQNLNLFDF